MSSYFLYMMTSESGTLYTGVTNDLERRVSQHQRKAIPGFTATYNVNRLAYFEAYGNINAAIAREKQIKRWSRKKKLALIRTLNPTFADLSSTLFH